MSEGPSVFSERSQIAILWWGIAFAVIYGLAFVFLLDLVPPPSPTWNSEQVAVWYGDNRAQILIGATLCGWTGGFMLPILTVVAKQIARVEGRDPIWAWLSLVGGALMSLFLALPPILLGAAAFTADRSPDATGALHDLAMVTLVTTDQYFVFVWIAVSVMCWRPATAQVANNPFPRWWGYVSLWMCVMFEAGALAFLTRTGPIAWDGLLPFWLPLTLFAVWITVQCRLTFKALRGQIADRLAGEVDARDAVVR